LRDSTGRNIDYLRISVTDECNLRCTYCAPQDGARASSRHWLLSPQDIWQVAQVAMSLGVNHVRLTGGEPLTRSDLPSIVSGLRDLGVPDISLTTNGTHLVLSAATLKQAGLRRVNVSLDSLRRQVYRSITGAGRPGDVMLGIRNAIDAGLSPVKINTVLMAGINDGEILDLARLSLSLPVHVRFIEVMPIGPDPDANASLVVPMDRAREEVASLGKLEPVKDIAGAGPAESFRLPRALGTVGFIAPLTHPFCASCNRLRVTADGKLRPCLASDAEVDLMPALRGDDVPGGLEAAFRQALLIKPASHDLWNHRGHARRMCQIGG